MNYKERFFLKPLIFAAKKKWPLNELDTFAVIPTAAKATGCNATQQEESFSSGDKSLAKKNFV